MYPSVKERPRVHDFGHEEYDDPPFEGHNDRRLAPQPWQQFVTLPATGKYVPTDQYRATPDEHESTWWISDSHGTRMALARREPDAPTSATMRRHTDALAFANEVACFAELVGLEKSEALAPLCELLIDEAEKVYALDAATKTNLVWCTNDDTSEGRWRHELFLDARKPADRAEILYARDDAAFYWLDGNKHPFTPL